MNTQEFVKALKTVAVDNALETIFSQLAKPAGRKPNDKLLTLSVIFNQMSNEDKKILGQVIVMASNLAAYSFLGILDGTIQIEDAGPKGELKLFFEKNGESILLNNPNEEELTSIFKTV
jgi:hypothetical protein